MYLLHDYSVTEDWGIILIVYFVVVVTSAVIGKELTGLSSTLKSIISAFKSYESYNPPLSKNITLRFKFFVSVESLDMFLLRSNDNFYLRLDFCNSVEFPKESYLIDGNSSSWLLCDSVKTLGLFIYFLIWRY